LIVLGGSDVDPLLYGGAADERRRLDRERDAFELEQLRLALDRGRPVLGICRGAQLLNIVHGGSLVRYQPGRRRTPLPRRRINIAAGTALASALGSSTWINSLHEYAVDTVGTGMIVAARDDGGVVQAIELAPDEGRGDRFAVGVQWHPELMPYLRDSRRLFAALVAAANAS
jgi:putative glutamine amidotransferase